MPKEVRAAVVDVDEWPPMRCYTCCKPIHPSVMVSGSPLGPLIEQPNIEVKDSGKVEDGA